MSAATKNNPSHTSSSWWGAAHARRQLRGHGDSGAGDQRLPHGDTPRAGALLSPLRHPAALGGGCPPERGGCTPRMGACPEVSASHEKSAAPQRGGEPLGWVHPGTAPNDGCTLKQPLKMGARLKTSTPQEMGADPKIRAPQEIGEP